MIVMRIRGKPGNYKQGEWHWFILAGSECIAKCYEYYALDTSLGSIEEIPPAKARIILGRQLSEIARSRIKNGLVTMLYRGTSNFNPANLIVPSERYL